jgi:hypothetical protein
MDSPFVRVCVCAGSEKLSPLRGRAHDGDGDEEVFGEW